MIKHMLLNKRGFTLIEITIAVAVLGILAGMVTFGYQGYVKNVRQTQTIAVAESSINTIRAYTLEHNTYPGNTCLPINSYCCYRTPFISATVPIMCEDYTSTDPQTSPIGKYISNQPTYLPTFPSMHLCRPDILDPWAEEGGTPCTTDGNNKVGVFYTPNQYEQTALFGHSDSSVKGFLFYYIGSDYKCGMNNLFTVTSGPGPYGDGHLFTLDPASSGANYSEQFSDPNTNTSYNECIVGIRAK